MKHSNSRRELTKRQQAFIEHYLICWNASEAARRAAYKTKPNVIGAQLLANPSIQQAISIRLSELKMSADEVLKRLADHARGSMEDFVTGIEGTSQSAIDLRKARRLKKLHLIKRYSKTKQGVSIELYDAQSALEKLGRAHALFVERIQLDWREEARKAGIDPDVLSRNLVEANVAALVGAGAGGSLEESATPSNGSARMASDSL